MDEVFRLRELQARKGPYNEEERKWLQEHSPYRRDLRKIRDLEAQIEEIRDQMAERNKTCQHLWIAVPSWPYHVEDCVLCGKSETY